MLSLQSYLSNKDNILITNNLIEYLDNNTFIYKDINKIKSNLLTNNINILITTNLLHSQKDLKDFINTLKQIKKYCKKNNIDFNSKIIYIIYITDISLNELSKNENIYNLINSIYVIRLNSKKEQYNYLYDVVCDYLDTQFKRKNLCDFKNGKCIANRNHYTVHEDNGCCYYIKYMGHLNFNNCGYCPNLSKTGCTIKCISCKFFTCKYYRKHGIKFEPQNIFLINTFFNKSQILVLKYNIYRTKDEIINKLINTKFIPSFISLITKSYYIKGE